MVRGSTFVSIRFFLVFFFFPVFRWKKKDSEREIVSMSFSFFFFVLMLTCALGWGPVSHAVFATGALADVDFSAVDAPDGFAGFMAPSFSYAPFAGTCPDTFSLHDPVLIGEVIQSTSRTDPGYKRFLLSYLSHMIGDLVGFSKYGGYLSNVTAGVNWVTMWTKMQAIDSYLFQTRNMSSFSVPYLNATLMEFFSQDIWVVGKLNFSASVLLECGNAWIDVQNQLLGLYRVQGDMTKQLSYFDTRGRSPVSTVRALTKNVNCAIRAVSFFIGEITQGSDPKKALADLDASIQTWYNQAICI